jgi:hypothetical protein
VVDFIAALFAQLVMLVVRWFFNDINLRRLDIVVQDTAAYG